jgi:hypothetical protein
MLEEHPDRLDVNEYTSHHFCTGLYIREMFLPKGTMLVGKEHLVENFFHVAVGYLTIWSEEGEVDVEEGFMGLVPIGAKRVGYAHEDTICFNTIPNPDDCTDIPTLEARFFKEDKVAYETGLKSAAIVAGVVAVGSGLIGASRSKKANKRTRQANKERHKADLMTQFLKRRTMLQQFRMLQAQVKTAAVASGAEFESSAVQGSMSSLTSNAIYSLNAEEQTIARENKAFARDQQAANLQGDAAMWSAVSSAASMVSGMLSDSGPGGGITTAPTAAQSQRAVPLDFGLPSSIGTQGGPSSLLSGGPPNSFAPRPKDSASVNSSVFTP